MSESKSRPKILILMSGSIACFKVCSLISTLVKNGFHVKVAASSSALKFIGSATIEGLTGEPVYNDLWEKGSAMEHIHLERWADLILASPATAHLINRMAAGIGDDLLTTLFLAHEFKKPFLMAPAMNTAMYLHPATQKSLASLKDMGVQILEAASGVLACGEVGIGRLLEPDLLYQEVLQHLKIETSNFLTGPLTKNPLRVLVTAGGTQEPLDDVRFITNRSTGITGENIARLLAEFGHDVTLDLASNSLAETSPLYRLERFDSYESLQNLLEKQLKNNAYDLVFHAAAVSDFSARQEKGKLSSDQDLTLHLKRNPKLVNYLKSWSLNKNMKLVAFKLTSGLSQDAIFNKVQHLFEESHADYIIQNDVSSLHNRNQHAFHVYDHKSDYSVSGVPDLVSSFLQKEFL